MRKIEKVIMILLLVLCISACSTKKPSDVAKDYLKDIKQNISKVMNEEMGDLTDGDQTVYAALTDSMDDFDYEIISEEIDGDEAIVKAKITTYAYGSALTNMFADYLTQAFALALGGASEEMLQNMMYQMFVEKVQEEVEKGKTYSGTVNIILSKKDGKWVAPETVDSDLQNAIMGNMLKIIESMD